MDSSSSRAIEINYLSSFALSIFFWSFTSFSSCLWTWTLAVFSNSWIYFSLASYFFFFISMTWSVNWMTLTALWLKTLSFISRMTDYSKTFDSFPLVNLCRSPIYYWYFSIYLSSTAVFSLRIYSALLFCLIFSLANASSNFLFSDS